MLQAHARRRWIGQIGKHLSSLHSIAFQTIFLTTFFNDPLSHTNWTECIIFFKIVIDSLVFCFRNLHQKGIQYRSVLCVLVLKLEGPWFKAVCTLVSLGVTLLPKCFVPQQKISSKYMPVLAPSCFFFEHLQEIGFVFLVHFFLVSYCTQKSCYM